MSDPNSIWNDPDLQAGGDYFKFEQDGDYVDGLVNVVRLHRFEDNSVAPQLLLTLNGARQNGQQLPPGEDRTVTCGAIRLKLEVTAQRPNPGDRVYILLERSERRQGGKTLKYFQVKVQRNAGQPNVNAGGAYQQPAAAAPTFQQQPAAQQPQTFQQPPQGQQQPAWQQPAQQPQSSPFGGQPPQQQAPQQGNPFGGQQPQQQPAYTQEDPWATPGQQPLQGGQGGNPFGGASGEPPF